MIVKLVRRVLNFDKIFRSYGDFDFCLGFIGIYRLEQIMLFRGLYGHFLSSLDTWRFPLVSS